MSIFKKKSQKRSDIMFAKWLTEAEISSQGYTSLGKCPEVVTAVDRISDLIASMTIYLMENGKNGDKRISNELSRKVDIYPYKNMTRFSWTKWIVKTMLIEGDGNAIVMPITKKGLLDELLPIPSYKVRFNKVGDYDYSVKIGERSYDPSNLLHFTINPDPDHPWMGMGYRVSLKDVTDNLKQAADTKKAFMSSKWKPSMVIKVDALTDAFSTPEGKQRILEDYVQSNEAGEPWLVPAEQFEVQQIKPLSLNDLAISDTVVLDKRAVASIFGVPPFVLGVGEFNRQAWNSFINSRIMPIAKGIEQELTKKLLINPKWYFKFNSRSLYSYDLKDLSMVADDQYIRGIMTGNEVRSWLDLSPMEGLDELIILENFIPAGMIGEQNKLKGGESSE